jgi:hypothetical protein
VPSNPPEASTASKTSTATIVAATERGRTIRAKAAIPHSSGVMRRNLRVTRAGERAREPRL